jgi:hypothetical protein
MPKMKIKLASEREYPNYESDFSDPTNLRLPWDFPQTPSMQYLYDRAAKRVSSKGMRAGWAAMEALMLLAPEVAEEVALADLDPSIDHSKLPDFWHAVHKLMARHAN